MNTVSVAFDRMASAYDAQWTHAPAGRLQRDVVWRVVNPLVHPGMKVLDLGCGTGEDALYLTSLGATVDAVDASPEMVRIARQKGVDARVLRIEDAAAIKSRYDLILSNFGAVNCVANLPELGPALKQLVKPGGYAVLCLLSRFCAWETGYYAVQGQWRKSLRRWKGTNHSSIGIDVLYHSSRDLRSALDAFHLESDYGVGIAVPPSYVPPLKPSLLARCAYFDRYTSPTVVGRALADHRVYVFRREVEA